MSNSTSPKSPSPFTWKGLVAGISLSLLVGTGVPYAVLLVGGADLARNSSLPAAIFLLFILAIFVNALLGAIRRQLALSKADLVMAYVMALLAATVPTQAFVGYLIPVISGWSTTPRPRTTGSNFSQLTPPTGWHPRTSRW